jgi:hypothetical protein
MCLTSIEQIFVSPIDIEWKVGYKVMEPMEGDKRFVFPIAGFTAHMLGEHLIDDVITHYLECDSLLENIPIYYPCGYHIYDELKSAEDSWLNCRHSVVIKIRYRSVVAIGYECDDKIIVAREIIFDDYIN